MDLFIRFDGTAFVRVVDYKTGTKVFDLNELTAGLNMQMLLYLFIICDNSRRYLAGRGELQPAGVLYQPLADVTVPRGTADAERARLRAMRMNGLVLDDPGIVQAMEEQGEQVFIPAGLDKGGTVKGSAVTARQFRLLRGVVEQLLTRMAEQLLTGDIAAVPLVDGLYSPCDCCDYRAVCARDREEPVRSLQKRPMQAVLEELATSADGQDGGAEKEENGNGTSMDR